MLSTLPLNGDFQNFFQISKRNEFLPIIIHFKIHFFHFENCQHFYQTKIIPHPLNRGNVNQRKENKVKRKFQFFYHYEELQPVVHNGKTALRARTVKDTVEIETELEATARMLLYSALAEGSSHKNTYILIKEIKLISDKDGD